MRDGEADERGERRERESERRGEGWDVRSCMYQHIINTETIMAKSFSQSFGGKGANQAVQAAKLSESPNYVAMLGMVGTDTYGKETRDNFTSCNVGVKELKEGKVRTMGGGKERERERQEGGKES